MSKDRGRDTVSLNEGRKKSRRDLEEEFRNQRVPIGGHRQKLKAPKISGYKTHWFNDEGNRLEDALRAGYQFVSQEFTPIGVGEGLDGNTDMGSFISKATDREKGTRSYLMAIRQDWFDEDQKVKQEVRRKKKASIRQGRYEVGGEPNKMYVPSSGIKIDQKTVRG